MNTGAIVVIVVLAVVVALGWLLLKNRRGQGVETPIAPPAEAPPAELSSAAAAAMVVSPEPTAPVVVEPPAPPPAPAPVAPPRPVAMAPAPPAPMPPPPAESITVIMARPKPPVPVVERVLALEAVDVAEWEAARPLTLSAVQCAAVAGAMTAAIEAEPHRGEVHAIRFDAGSAIGVARGDLETLRALAASGTAAPAASSGARWLDSAAATALAATALAALANERWLAALGDEIRELKARLAALPTKLAAQDEGRLKALLQDLSRFAREARDNYVSVIGKFAFRERVAEGCERAEAVWHGLVAACDALRQSLAELAGATRFGEVQVERTLAQWRALLDQERLQEIAARVLAGMHTLRLALGDGGPPGGVDPLASAVAALQAGIDEDRDLAVRLLACEAVAKGDPYVGRGEFEANRAALRKLLDKPIGESMGEAMSRLEAAAATAPLDAAGSGAPSRLLVCHPSAPGTAAVRWSSAPLAG